MTATITNHTNPGQTPVQGDLVTTESEGMSITKEYFPPLDNTPSETELARFWRDEELRSSDWIVPTSDYPQRAAYLTYRAALRDWPSTADFPDTKPTLGS